jgi:hypothetical protein
MRREAAISAKTIERWRRVPDDDDAVTAPSTSFATLFSVLEKL